MVGPVAEWGNCFLFRKLCRPPSLLPPISDVELFLSRGAEIFKELLCLRAKALFGLEWKDFGADAAVIDDVISDAVAGLDDVEDFLTDALPL